MLTPQNSMHIISHKHSTPTKKARTALEINIPSATHKKRHTKQRSTVGKGRARVTIFYRSADSLSLAYTYSTRKVWRAARRGTRPLDISESSFSQGAAAPPRLSPPRLCIKEDVSSFVSRCSIKPFDKLMLLVRGWSSVWWSGVRCFRKRIRRTVLSVFKIN